MLGIILSLVNTCSVVGMLCIITPLQENVYKIDVCSAKPESYEPDNQNESLLRAIKLVDKDKVLYINIHNCKVEI